MISIIRHGLLVAFPACLGLLCAACGDDDNPAGENASDAGQAGGLTQDAAVNSNTAATDAAFGDASDAGVRSDPTKPKAACELLSAAEVAAILGTAQKATDLVGGMQCQYSSLDAEKKDVRALLEVVTNGRAIYAANFKMYAEAGQTPVVQSGVGDQAYFITESVVRSSLSSTVGDVLLRLNLGWGEPGVTSDVQLAGERTLMSSAIGKL